MSDNYVVVEQSGAVLTITLNRPEKKNALVTSMYAAMIEALKGAEADDSVNVVLLQGNTDAFSAGNDLGDFLSKGLGLDSIPMDFLRTLVNFKKPLVAAVSGVAIGIGVTTLLHCDLVYVAKNAKLRLPFVNLALVPEGGSSLLLPQKMGHQRASELLLLGDFFDAETARDYGLANDVFDTDHIFEDAMTKAQQLAAQPKEAVQKAKEMIKSAYLHDLQKVIEVEGEIFTERLSSDEAKEIMSKFMSKG